MDNTEKNSDGNTFVSSRIISLLNILALFFVSIFVCLFLQKDALFGDINVEGLGISFRDFIYPIHGRYFTGILIKTIGLANQFGIHPMTFVNTISSFMRAVCTAGLIYILVNGIYFFKKKDIFMPVYIILTFIICFYFNLFELKSITQFFGYAFQMILFLFVWGYAIKSFVNHGEYSLTKKHIYVSSLLMLVLGTFSIFMNIASAIIILILFIIYLLKTDKPVSFPLSSFIKKIKSIELHILIPCLFFFSGFLIAYLNPLPILRFSQPHQIHFSIKFAFNSFEMMPEFIVQYLDRIIFHLWPALAGILILMIFVFIFSKDKLEAKSLIEIVSIFLLGIFAFYLSLLFLGKTFYVENMFWLNHTAIYNMYKISLFFIFLILSGYFMQIFDGRFRRICLHICLMFILVLPLFQTGNFIKKIGYRFENNIKTSQQSRESIYTIDKLCIFYFTKGETAILPANTVLKMWLNILPFPFSDLNKVYRDEIDAQVRQKEFYGYLSEHIKNKIPIHNSIYLNSYFYNIYKLDTKKGFILVEDKDAMREFSKRGGIISEEEIKQSNFQRLLEYRKKFNI